MPGNAAKVIITERQQEILLKLSRSRTESSQRRQRATIILLAFEGKRNDQIAPIVDLGRDAVGIWRRRWADRREQLVLIECVDGMTKLRRAIGETLSDAPRSGSPGKFSAEQLTQLIALACESPRDSGRDISHWTCPELAKELVKRKVVESISSRHVGRILAEADLKPHHCKYWLHTKEKDPEVFAEQVETVCRCYQEAPRLHDECETCTVCVDEMTGIQALERIAPNQSMKRGKPERIENEYKRHGTQCLTGNFDVVTGEIVSPTIGATRTEPEFVAHIERTVRTDPKKTWIFVADNLNTHCSESLVGYVAKACGIETELGVKGREGILKSMATRREFLMDSSHGIRFVYTPKHSSWLNQIEIWFSILARRVIKRGSFESVEDLRDRILGFIDYFNKTLAKPFRWTYTGRPLRAGIQV